ncbi:MAG TPA: hypothetical protein VF198_18540 [Vicinamibacterales bacterium]
MAWLLPYVLIGLGVGFLVANIRVVAQFVRYLRLRRRALLTWPGPPPPYYGLILFLAVALGLLLIVKVAFLPHTFGHLFGEGMMFLYFGYAVPLSRRIGRGFYEDGVWAENGFIPYHQIAGIAWRDGEPPRLLLISRFKELARTLFVPGDYYAAVRRLLRDKIGAHDIMFSGDTLDLGGHDERDDV